MENHREFKMAGSRIHFPANISSLLPEIPFYMHQIVAEPPSLPPPPPPPPVSSSHEKMGWDNLFGGGGTSLIHGTNSRGTGTNVRWPRQETLTLLEIRSRLDPYFKEATSSNQKAPLWDEVSRIMKEEYGYERSGRKCKEKFDNLFKYYKKTKEGKIGKNDGKHYRFFRQLEALYGDKPSNQLAANLSNYSRSLSNYSSEFENSSSPEKKKISDQETERKGWIDTMEEYIESNLVKLMDKQDDWGEKILCSIENKEQERILREEEWRKHEAARLNQEYEAWASHMAHTEARDKTLLEVLQNLSRVRSTGSSSQGSGDIRKVSNVELLTIRTENGCPSNGEKCGGWIEPEISSLIHIRTSMEGKVQESLGESLWEEVALRLSFLGYNRSKYECRETWERICMHFNETTGESEKGPQEDSRTSNSFDYDAAKNAVLLGSCFSSTMNIGEHSLENT